MNSIIPVRVTISELVLTLENAPHEELTVCIIFNHISNVFKPPFCNLPNQLVNFPMVSTMYFKFFHKSRCISEASYSIEPLQEKKGIDITVDLKFPEEVGSPEKFRPVEAKNCSLTGSFKALIEKEDIELKNCQLTPILDNFTTVSERALEIILETNRGKNEKYISRINELGIFINEIEEGEMTAHRARNIRCLLVGANEKLKVLDLFIERCENLGEQVAEEQKSRQSMQNALKKTCRDYAESKNRLDRMASQLEKKCSDLSKRNFELESVEKRYIEFKKDKDLEIDMLRAKISQLTAMSPTGNISDSLKSTESFKEATSELQKSDIFNKAVGGYQKTIEEYQQNLQDLSQDNANLSESLEKTNKINKELKSENDALLSESQYLKSKLAEYETRMMYVKELEMQIKKIEDSDSKSRDDHKSMQEQLEKLAQGYSEGTRGLYTEKLELLEANKKLIEEVNTLKKELMSHKLGTHNGNSKDNLEFSNSAYSSLTIQYSKLLQDSKDLFEISIFFKRDFVQEFNSALKSTIDISERYLNLQRLLSKIMASLKDKEVENQILRQLVVDLQKDKPVYVPVRGDFIDNTLANYLNSRASPCSVPFTRLDNGVYLFGTKRVVLRIENIGIVIRVGGGFIKIEDFINSNTTSEKTRIKLKDKASTPRMVVSPLPEEIERVSSPKIAYSQRGSISSSIPMPKSVISTLQKKGSATIKDVPKSPITRRGTIV